MMNCVLLLLLSVGGCVASDLPAGVLDDMPKLGLKLENNKDSWDQGLQLKDIILPDIKDVDKNEFREDIVRPCILSDWSCIRKFLAANSECKPAYGPDPDPLYVPYDKLLYPSINLTVTLTNAHVEGLKSAKITEFYVNKFTGNLVLAFNVRDFRQTSTKSYFTYQRTAKEPIVLGDFTTEKYDSITFTAIIPKVPHLRLELAEMHADVHDGNPTYFVGPRAYNSTDPDVIAAFAELNLNIKTIIREQFNFQAYLFTGVFIERSLCDFGVDVYDNYLQYLRTKAYTITPYKRQSIAAEITRKSSHH